MVSMLADRCMVGWNPVTSGAVAASGSKAIHALASGDLSPYRAVRWATLSSSNEAERIRSCPETTPAFTPGGGCGGRCRYAKLDRPKGRWPPSGLPIASRFRLAGWRFRPWFRDHGSAPTCPILRSSPPQSTSAGGVHLGRPLRASLAEMPPLPQARGRLVQIVPTNRSACLNRATRCLLDFRSPDRPSRIVRSRCRQSRSDVAGGANHAPAPRQPWVKPASGRLFHAHSTSRSP